MSDTYNWRADCLECWRLGMRIFRREGIIQRRIDPATETERVWWLA